MAKVGSAAMFWKRNKTVCNHEWFELKRGTDYIGAIPIEKVMNIYCPKCDKHRKVSEYDGELILKANEIKKNYQRPRGEKI
ncbi:hypothetical protein D3C78_1466820 [compost metagenome]